MNSKKIITILLIGITVGFITGLVDFFWQIIANQYIQYKMYRIVAVTFQKSLNNNIFYVVTLSLALLILWFFIMVKLKCDKIKIARITITVIVTFSIFLLINYLFKNFTTYPTLLFVFKKFVIIFGNLLIGNLSFGYFLSLLEKYIIAIIVLICGIIGMMFLYWLLTKIKWEKILAKINLRKLSQITKTRFFRRIPLALVVFLLILNLCIVIDSKINAPEGPNIIILLIDALRKDHVGVYGYNRDTTPNIDLFSQKAIVSQDVVSQSSWTVPSVASLFSSLYPSVHGTNTHHGKKKSDSLDKKIVTFAEVLKEKGYVTGAFVANCLICKRFFFDQGFDVYDPIDKKAPKPLAEELNKKALKWIKKNKKKPFFTYLHYMDVHGPYEAPKPYDSFFKSIKCRPLSIQEANKLQYLSHGRERDNNNLNYYIDQYDGEIRYVDYHIGQFLKRLKEYGLFDNTIIIITSDHGEAFFEHGFCDHGWSLYDEEINIPLIVKFPKSIKFKNFCHHRIELFDINATILYILNYNFPYKTNDKNLISDLNDETFNDFIFSEELSNKPNRPPKIAMIKGDFKAIYMVDEEKVTELYDLEKDKLEEKNLINVELDRHWEFEKEIESWQKEKLQEKNKLGLEKTKVVRIEQIRIEQLKSLGYLQYPSDGNDMIE